MAIKSITVRSANLGTHTIKVGDKGVAKIELTDGGHHYKVHYTGNGPAVYDAANISNVKE